MTIPGYQFRDYLQFLQRKNVTIMLLKILTHSMAGSVTFCFDVFLLNGSSTCHQ